MQLSLSYPHSQGYQSKVALIAKNDFQKCYCLVYIENLMSSLVKATVFIGKLR